MEIQALSGGNQQKVVIGRSLLTNPKVLFLDEPTRGIDVGAKADVFRMMVQLSQQGIAVVFSTSDLKEIMAVSDRNSGDVRRQTDRRYCSRSGR
ncbi:Xylose import ATP-binding protein XylG [Leclercia adecarboxylata]|uniref:Xylose import ATP-binding protein XylG n=1 Tax=Leclercia adecarboxylata TaxID=83655 RepID=A0A4U9HLF2_9ENTR|nr:Xylose import ATP-binding protein XylG [Leclercia adecarboxylata]